MVIGSEFWNKKTVLITGHTGFKGGWLCIWLHSLGANVIGYSLDPPTQPSLFELAHVAEGMTDIRGDVRNLDHIKSALVEHKPQIVIHMAAQPLVRYSYAAPVETYATNVMGTINILEAVRQMGGIRVVMIITSDKCYENREWIWGYRESESMGGYDPYSSSKGCAELVTTAYRSSFFNPERFAEHGTALASARAGNVIGGGDWATDRLIPDCIRAILKGEKIVVRNPLAIRPWQHVLEPLSGYLLLAQRLYEDGAHFSEAWNFGPHDDNAKSVESLVNNFCKKWGSGASYVIEKGQHPHEAHFLRLDCSKASHKLHWEPRWDLEKALESIIEWTIAYKENKNLREVCLKQIREYLDYKIEVRCGAR